MRIFNKKNKRTEIVVSFCSRCHKFHCDGVRGALACAIARTIDLELCDD